MIVRPFVLAILLGCSAPAIAVPSWVIPSPITIAIQVGKWLQSNDEEVYYVRVQSKGSTEGEARTEAFRLAVDQAVGSLLVSESEIQDGTVARHDVINYSSGYVYDFEYVNIHRQSGEVILQIDVYVRKSMIADRIATNSKEQKDLQGGRIAEAFKSIQQEQKTGDNLLKAVIGDFPHKAIKVDNIDVSYSNPNRQPTLNVHFQAYWSQEYLKALQESIKNTMTPIHEKNLRENGIVFFDHKCVWSCYDAYTTDESRFAVFYNGVMDYSAPMVQVELLDVHHNPVHTTCYALYQNLYVYKSNWTFEIRSKAVTSQNFDINLANMDISVLDQVDLKIVPYRQCNL